VLAKQREGGDTQQQGIKRQCNTRLTVP